MNTRAIIFLLSVFSLSACGRINNGGDATVKIVPVYTSQPETCDPTKLPYGTCCPPVLFARPACNYRYPEE